MRERIEWIDFARGYSIFTIVCYHGLQRVALPPLWAQAIAFGGTGVHLFFLLSGFGFSLSERAFRPGIFFRKRLMKVWLPYVLALCISWFAAAGFHLFPDGLHAWLAGVSLYQMFSEQYIESFGGHFWFISAIAGLYLAYPLLLYIQRRAGDGVMLVFATAGSLVWWWLVFFLEKGHLRTWNSFFLQFLWEFALGMALAGWYKTHTAAIKEWSKKRWWLGLPAGALFTALMVLMLLKMGDAGRIFNDPPALAGYAAICFFLYGLGRHYTPLLERFFRWIGGFSYSLYLIHVLVLTAYLCLLDRFHIPAKWPFLLPFPVLALLAGKAFESLSRRWTALFDRK
ncbi:MAG: acyltransferase [Lewinellaceae bacterium]|nr:acyltransferase [Lewinellaceae bacterium]